MIRLHKVYTTINVLMLVAVLAILAPLALAAPPVLELPISCTIRQDCFIQNYFDNNPGLTAHDYTCGTLTYDTHHGTDFRLRDLAAMRRKVAVVAVAPGIVVGVRDGEPDVYLRQRDKASLKGKEAGNAVRIDHGDGWSTQYSHMLLGSIAVRKGQQVNTGDVLGIVGLSGNTEFPHLDFSISRDGKSLDPFNPEAKPCGKSDKTLWSAMAMKSLRYQPTGILIAGFSVTPPQKEIAEAGGYKVKTIPADAENMIFWVELFGLHKGDHLVLELYGPGNQRIANSPTVLPGDKAVWFAYGGKRRKGVPWPKGNYSALIRLERAGKVVVEERKEAEVQ